MLADDLPEFHKLWGRVTCFVKGSIVIIAADLWLIGIAVIIIGAIHKAAGCAAMKHIHIDGQAAGEDRIQTADILCGGDGMVLGTPPVEPGRIPFRYKEGAFSFVVGANDLPDPLRSVG